MIIYNHDAIHTVLDREKLQKQIFADVKNISNTVSDKAKNVDTMICNLKTANDGIVDSINQLSATSEEVNASAEESANTTHRNAENTKTVKELF